jgi:hypothetical protein
MITPCGDATLNVVFPHLVYAHNACPPTSRTITYNHFLKVLNRNVHFTLQILDFGGFQTSEDDTGILI